MLPLPTESPEGSAAASTVVRENLKSVFDCYAKLCIDTVWTALKSTKLGHRRNDYSSAPRAGPRAAGARLHTWNAGTLVPYK